MSKVKSAVSIEAANRNRQSVDYNMKLAMNKARISDKHMLDLLYDDAKVTFELYFDQLRMMAGE